MMAKSKRHPEFSVPQGYFMMDDTQRGLSPGLYTPVSYDEAAAYGTPYLRDIETGMRTDYTDTFSPLTTKGDIMSHDGTADTRVGVGDLWQTIIADPAQTSGVRWSDRFWMPNPSRRLFGWQQAYMDVTTIAQLVNSSGTVDANGSASVLKDTASYINYASAAALNSDAGWTQSAGQDTCTFGMSPIIHFLIKTGPNDTDIDANTRFVIGLYDSSPTGTPMGQDFTGAIDTDYIVFSGIGTTITGNTTGTGAREAQSTGVTVAKDTRYILTIDATSTSSIKFYVNGVLKTTHSTVLPSTTSELEVYCAIRTLDATARNLRISRVVGWHD